MTSETPDLLDLAFQPPRGRLLTIVRKELWSHLVSPISYVILLLFYWMKGYFLLRLISRLGDGGTTQDFASGYLLDGATTLAVLIFPPLLTMRAFADEKRTGSLELLMTAPVKDYEVVLGKWLAAWIFYSILFLPSFLLLLVLQGSSFLDVSLPIGQVLAGYIGLFLLGSMLLGAGIFASSLTDNQLLASLSALIFGYAVLYIPPQILSDKNVTIDSAFYKVMLDQLYVSKHLSLWFFRGLIDTGYVVFYVTTTALFLFLTVRVVESRKWR